MMQTVTTSPVLASLTIQ